MAAGYRNGGVPRFQTVAEAAQSQAEDAVLDMLKEGADVNSVDMDGNTALHWAVWFRLDILVGQLLERGAQPDARNAAGESPVHWAAKASSLQAIQAMMRGDHGMLSHRDCDGLTPFIILAQNDNSPIMEWMYLKGVSVEEQDNWGRTGLHWACYKGHRRTVQWLLSRSADLSHRDHEGMTAVHWASLKGHDAVSDMLVNVGAVNLLNTPDAAGDTPVDLARRKKNRYLVISFYKCQLFNILFGRPNLAHNNFAGLFAAFAAFNVAVFVGILAPGIASKNPGTVVTWCLLMAATLLLWARAYRADPGWLTPQTVLPQARVAALVNFDTEQPVESQMAHVVDRGPSVDTDDLVRLELEQTKYNYQRQLLTAARRRLEENGLCSSSGANNGHRAWETQPLMGGAADPLPIASQVKQLDSASFELKRRCLATSASLSRERIAQLHARGDDGYLDLLEKGCFKKICVVCRATKEMRSHHCKDCGRCVRRLDHHCPWIDNCVGLGNQRTFYCFIVVLLATLVGFYVAAVLFVTDAIIPAWTSGEAFRTLITVSEWSLGPELRPLLVLIASVFNAVWLAFVGALVVRHSAYMAVNVTTFEVLTRPAHVQRRFPRSKGRCWFLQGCDPLASIRNILAYWMLDMDQDAEDFIVPEGTTLSQDDSSARGCRRRGVTEAPEQANAGGVADEAGMEQKACEAERLEGFIACEQPDQAQEGPSPQQHEHWGRHASHHNAQKQASGATRPDRPGSGLWPRDM